MHQDDRVIRRERRLLVLLAVISLGLVGGALYLQFVKGEDPCPLCIIQRYFFVLIAVFALLGASFRGWRGIALLETMVALSALGGVVAAGIAPAKGWLACSMVFSTTRAKLEPTGAAVFCRPNWLPANTRIEKGIRNFTDAASQSQYRTAARFFRSASVERPATTANRVDCHR